MPQCGTLKNISVICNTARSSQLVSSDAIGIYSHLAVRCSPQATLVIAFTVPAWALMDGAVCSSVVTFSCKYQKIALGAAILHIRYCITGH